MRFLFLITFKIDFKNTRVALLKGVINVDPPFPSYNVLDIEEDGCIMMPLVNRFPNQLNSGFGIRVAPQLFYVKLPSVFCYGQSTCWFKLALVC
jgi:hypothetical protein